MECSTFRRYTSVISRFVYLCLYFVSGAENVLDLTFGTNVEGITFVFPYSVLFTVQKGATITSAAELGNVCWFWSLFGDVSNVRNYPMAGIANNLDGMYSFYPEFEADNKTRNPLALHQVCFLSSLCLIRYENGRPQFYRYWKTAYD
jgi:hypothetical protein